MARRPHVHGAARGFVQATFRPEIEVHGITTRVMVEQLTVIDPQSRLGEFAGRLSGAELLAVDSALLAVLGLD